MKAPADYLNCPVFELTYPTGESAESVPVVAYHDAVRAIETALADAEEYKYLLMRALRRRNADDAALTLPSFEGTVRPMYQDLAA